MKLAACLLSVLTGCAAAGANSATLEPDQTAQIEVQDQGLQERCEILRGGAAQQGKHLTAWVLLLNADDEPVALESRWLWHDAQGAAVESDPPWEELRMEASSKKRIETKAASTKAARATFELRFSIPKEQQ